MAQIEVSWWIKGGSDLRIVEGKDILNCNGEMDKNQALAILEDSLEDFSTKFATEHYLIEAGVWDFGVTSVLTMEEKQKLEDEAKSKEIDWDAEWKHATYMHQTGMPKSYLKREMICPDCGGKLFKSYQIIPDHLVYLCHDCDIMLKDKGNKTSWKCREW
jgi:hypothetical protein